MEDNIKSDEKQKTDVKAEEKTEEKTGRNGKRKRTAASFMIEFFIKIGITAIVIAVLLTFICGVYVNHSNSAYPMLKDGDLCITYKLADLVKGDEITYIKDGKIRFGRIVAMPGDKVDVSEDVITVNGLGTFEDTVYPTTSEGSTIEYPYLVSVDTVFVLNDYRDDIADSRTYGSIPLSDTKGKVVLVLRRRGI